VADELGVTTPGTQSAQVGVPFRMDAPAVRNLQGALSWRMTSALPPGLSFVEGTGTLEGTPTSAGSWRVVHRATDAWDGRSVASDGTTIRVVAQDVPVPFSVQPLAASYEPTVGLAFGLTPHAIGAAGAVEWSVDGILPPWAGIDPATGKVSGTPDAPTAPATLSLVARDTSNGVVASSGSFTLAARAPVESDGAATRPSVVAYGSSAVSGEPLTTPTPLTANLAAPVTYALAAGTLPSSTALDAATGVISGTPKVIGAYDGIRLEATDATGLSVTSNAFALSVTAPVLPPVAGVSKSPSASIQAANSVQVGYPLALDPMATDLTPPLAWTSTGAPLPAWVALDPSTGRLTGTPGSSTFADGLHLMAVDFKGVAVRTNAFSISSVAAASLTASIRDTHSAQVGVRFVATPDVSGIQGTAAWRLETGTIPDGLSVNPVTGSLSGVPTVTGTFPGITLSVRDDSGTRVATNPLVLTVTPAPLKATAPALLSATKGVTYTSAATVAGATGAVTWSVASGTLPPGLSLASSTGVISGTPTAAGSFGGITVRAVDSIGAIGVTSSFTVLVELPPATPSTELSLTFPSGRPAPYGAPYLLQPTVLNAQGATTFEIASGTLPTWAKLDGATGAITGIPDAIATTPGLSLRVTDASGATKTSSVFAIPVTRTALSASGPGNVSGRSGVAMASQAPTASNAIGSVSWTLSAPASLPPGLSFDAATGVISGIPTAEASVKDLTLQARDSLGGVADTAAFTLTVSGAPKATALARYPGRVNAPFKAQPTATGLIGDVTWSLASGALPAWATLDGRTGAITGLPTATGVVEGLSLRVVDATGSAGTTDAFAISIATDLAVSYPKASFTARVGVAFATGTPTVTGGAGGVSWAVETGSMPDGLALDKSLGSISGTPTSPASVTLVLRATDADGSSVPANAFTLQVLAAPTVAMAQGATRTGTSFSLSPTVSDARGSQEWTLASGSLPGWATLNPTTGRISGKPDAVGTATGLSLRLRDGDGAVATTEPFTLAVTQGITVSGFAPTYAIRAGQVFPAQAPSVSNDKGAVSWTLASGAFPSGIALAANGTVSGTPTVTGGFRPTIRATDASDGSTHETALSFAVTEGIAITGKTGVVTHAGLGFATQALGLTGQRGTSVTWSVSSGSLPTWATLNTGTGMITGTAPAATTVTGLVIKAVDDGDGSFVLTAPFSIQVLPAMAVTNVATSYLGRVGFAFAPTAPSALHSGGATTWSWVDGVSPPGWLGLNTATGTIFGTPDEEGTTTGLRIQATDAYGGIAQSVPFDVVSKSDPVITLETTELSVRLGESVSLDPSVVGTVGTPGWSARIETGGGLQDGVTVDPVTGRLSGTPTADGTVRFRFRVTDQADGRTIDSAAVTLKVSPAMSVTAGSALVSGRQFSLVAAGPAPKVTGNVGVVTYQLSVAPPAGMTFSNGVLSGVPTETFPLSTVSLIARDAFDGKTVRASFQLSVVGSFDVGGAGTVSVRNGADAGYTSFTPAATNRFAGGTVTWSKGAGTWPNGVDVDPATGKLSGKPAGYAASTTFSPLVIAARDADGSTAQTASFSVTVTPGMAVTDLSQQYGRVNKPFVANLVAVNNTAGVTWTLADGAALPPGLTLASNGTVSGTPTSAGSFSTAVLATDRAKAVATGTLNVIVRPELLVTVPATTLTALVGDTPSLQATATGLVGTATWSLRNRSGTLPAGLALDATGKLTGKVTATGLATTYIRVVDSADALVAESPLVTVDSSASFSIGTVPTQYVRYGVPFRLEPPMVGKVPGTIVWSVPGTSILPGLTIDPATGVISGTPTGSLATNVSRTIRAVAAGQTVTSAAFTINASPPLTLPAVPDMTFPSGTALTNAVFAVASGNRGPLSYSANVPVAPLTIAAHPTTNTNVGISGTPPNGFLVSGVTVTVTDSYDGSSVTSNPFTISSAAIEALPAQKARVGNYASLPAPVATGFPGAPTWTLDASSPALAAGLSLDASTGVISGTPTENHGTRTLVLRAISGATSLVTKVDLVVRSALVVPTIPDLFVGVGEPLSFTTAVGSTTGGVNTLTWKANQALSPFNVAAGTSSRVSVSGTAPASPRAIRDVVLTVTDPYDGATASTNPFAIRVVSVTLPPPQYLRVGTPYVGPAPVVTGFEGPVTWTAPTLPKGLVVDQETGIVSGTPTATFSETAIPLKMASGTGSYTRTYTMVVKGTLRIALQPDVTFRVGETDDVPSAVASGRSGTLSWALSRAIPPVTAGLATNYPNQAIIKATAPAQAATFRDVTLTVTDSYDGVSATSNPFTVYVVGVTPPPLQKARMARPYTGPAPIVDGFPGPVTWTVSNMPPGLTLDPATGALSGTPTGTFNLFGSGSSPGVITLTATSGTSKTTAKYDMFVKADLKLPTQADMSFLIGGKVSEATVSASGESGSLSWTPSVPLAPVTVAPVTNDDNAVISASSATAPVTFTGVTLTVRDAFDGAEATSNPFNIYVTSISAPPLQLGRVGKPFVGLSPDKSGFPGPVTWTATNVPEGLTLDESTGAISGTPTARFSVTSSPGTPGTVTLTATSGTTKAVTTHKVHINAALTMAKQNDLTFRTGTNPSINGATTAGRVSDLAWAAAPSISPVTLSTVPDVGYGSFRGNAPSTTASFLGVTATATDPYDGETVTSNTFDVHIVDMTVHPLQMARVNRPYTSPVPSARGFPGDVTWSATNLPSTLRIDAVTGVISGTPSATFDGTVTLVATSGTASMSTTFRLDVNSDLTMPTQPDVTFVTGSNAVLNTAAVSGSISQLAWAASPSIAPVTVIPLSGERYGRFASNTPTAAATTTGVTLMATDPYDGATVTSNPFTVYMVEMTKHPAQVGRITRAYTSPTPSAKGFPGDVEWSAANLPGGLGIDGATGVISGTPSGTYNSTVTLTAKSGGASASTTFAMRVVANLTVPAMGNITLRTGSTDTFYGTAPSGGQGTVTWLASVDTTPVTVGEHSAGYARMSVVNPTAVASFPGVTLTGTDSFDGATVTTTPFDIRIVTVTTPAAPAGTRNVNYATTAPTALGFPGTVTWDLAVGALPATLTLDPATGVISGKPTGAHNLTLTLRATSGTTTANALTTINIRVP
jgi:hypothetical protein